MGCGASQAAPPPAAAAPAPAGDAPARLRKHRDSMLVAHAHKDRRGQQPSDTHSEVRARGRATAPWRRGC